MCSKVAEVLAGSGGDRGRERLTGASSRILPRHRRRNKSGGSRRKEK